GETLWPEDGRSSSSILDGDFSGTRGLKIPSDACHFAAEGFASSAGQPVEPPRHLVARGIGRRIDFLHQSFIGEPLERSVQDPGPQPRPPVGALEDVRHDAVAVQIATRQREEDLAGGGVKIHGATLAYIYGCVYSWVLGF